MVGTDPERWERVLEQGGPMYVEAGPKKRVGGELVWGKRVVTTIETVLNSLRLMCQVLC